MSALAVIKDPAPVDAASIEAWAVLIREAWGASVSGIIETGRRLTSAKQKVSHGDWERLCQELLPFSPNTASQLMQIAAHERLSNPAHAQELPASWSTLRVLAQLEVNTFDAALQAGVINPAMERRAAQRLVRAGSVEAFVTAPVSPSREEKVDAEEKAIEDAAGMVRRLMRMRVPVSGLDTEAVAMIEAVATVARCSVEAMFRADELHGDERWRATTARRLAIYMLHIECEKSQPQAARPFGLEPSGVSYIAKDFEDFREEPSFERLIQRILETHSGYLDDGVFE